MEHTSTGKSDKNRRIADSMRATYAKRDGQICRVFQCKIQRNKLTAGQKEELKMLFVEGKWCYNAILNSGESAPIFDYDTKSKTVVHKADDTHPDKELHKGACCKEEEGAEGRSFEIHQ